MQQLDVNGVIGAGNLALNLFCLSQARNCVCKCECSSGSEQSLLQELLKETRRGPVIYIPWWLLFVVDPWWCAQAGDAGWKHAVGWLEENTSLGGQARNYHHPKGALNDLRNQGFLCEILKGFLPFAHSLLFPMLKL